MIYKYQPSLDKIKPATKQKTPRRRSSVKDMWGSSQMMPMDLLVFNCSLSSFISFSLAWTMSSCCFCISENGYEFDIHDFLLFVSLLQFI